MYSPSARRPPESRVMSFTRSSPMLRAHFAAVVVSIPPVNSAYHPREAARVVLGQHDVIRVNCSSHFRSGIRLKHVHACNAFTRLQAIYKLSARVNYSKKIKNAMLLIICHNK